MTFLVRVCMGILGGCVYSIAVSTRFCTEQLVFLTEIVPERPLFLVPFGCRRCFHIRSLLPPLPPCSGRAVLGLLLGKGIVFRLRWGIFPYFSIFFYTIS